MKNLKQKGIDAFLWDFLGKIAIHGSTLIIGILLARLLEPSDFGMIAILMIIVTLASIFSDIGLSGALIQRRRVLAIHYSSVFYFNIAIGLLLTLLTFFSASFLANFYENQDLTPLMEVMSLLFVISAFHTVQTVILRKELNYKRLTQVHLKASIISGVTGVLLAFLGFGVWSLIAQIFMRELMINIFIWHQTTWKPSLSFSFKALQQLWGFGFNMFLAHLINAIYEKLDFLVIGKLFSATVLGYFYQAKQLNTFIVTFISNSLMSVLFPLLSKIQNDLARFQRVTITSLNLLIFITFLILGELYIISDELIFLLLGEKWIASIPYFKILVLSGFAFPIGALMVDILGSLGESKLLLKMEIYKKSIEATTLIVLYFYGIEAFLYAIFVTTIINTILNMYYSMKKIELPLFSTGLKPLFIQMALVVMTVLVSQYLVLNFNMAPFWMLLLKSILFLTLYLLINWIFKIETLTYTIKEFNSIRRMKNDK